MYSMPLEAIDKVGIQAKVCSNVLSHLRFF
jgi:hypothetical protein